MWRSFPWFGKKIKLPDFKQTKQRKKHQRLAVHVHSASLWTYLLYNGWKASDKKKERPKRDPLQPHFTPSNTVSLHNDSITGMDSSTWRKQTLLSESRPWPARPNHMRKQRRSKTNDWLMEVRPCAVEHTIRPRRRPTTARGRWSVRGSVAALWLVMCAWDVNHVQIFWEGTNKHC